MKVLVTDAELTLSLAALRSLARAGLEVVALSWTPQAIGFRSRSVTTAIVGPAAVELDAFAEFVGRTVAEAKIGAILPVGQDATMALAQRRDALPPEVAVALPPVASIEVAMSKRRTTELAASVGIRIPKTYAREEGVARFPAVAKHVTGSGEVRYLNSPDDLAGLNDEWLVQDYVPGEGRGLFALFNHGAPRAVFMHRRIREFPPTGGASTMAESVDDAQLRELGLRLLRKLDWHGVAMVEFKRERRDGGYTLMEVNPKLWGSLALAVAAGVDFPLLAVLLARGEPFEAPRYRVGLRFQWVAQDLLHAAARPRSLPAVLRDLADPRVRKDVAWRDPLPAIAEAGATFKSAIQQAHAGVLRAPHGTPDDRPG